jgi:hypothetical protein
MQTKSKNFKDHEIKGIFYENDNKVVYLKEGVRRKKYNDHLSDDEMHHINEQVILLEKINKFYLATGTTPLTDNNED